MNIEEIQDQITKLKTIIVKEFPTLNSPHEGMAVIRLQSDKLWEDIKKPIFRVDNSLAKDLQRQAGCITAAALYFLELICGVQNAMELAIAELNIAESKFPAFKSQWEGFFILQEEIDELWDVVKLNPKKIQVVGVGSDTVDLNDDAAVLSWQINRQKEILKEEAIQVAAMGIRFIKCLKESNA